MSRGEESTHHSTDKTTTNIFLETKGKKTTMMNERTYLNAILALDLSDELKDETNARLARLDSKNEKRKVKQNEKNKTENEPIVNAILEALGSGAMLSTDLATAIGQSVPKTNGIAGVLVNEKVLTKTKVKVKGKGEQTQYALAEVDEETADEVADEETAD